MSLFGISSNKYEICIHNLKFPLTFRNVFKMGISFLRYNKHLSCKSEFETSYKYKMNLELRFMEDLKSKLFCYTRLHELRKRADASLINAYL